MQDDFENYDSSDEGAEEDTTEEAAASASLTQVNGAAHQLNTLNIGAGSGDGANISFG